MSTSTQRENPAPTGIRPADRLAWHRQLTRDPDLSSVDIHVGLVISNHFNNGSGECFVSMETLVREVRVSFSTIERSVRKLAKPQHGHLKVKAGGGRGMANRYAMVIREPYPTTETPSPMTGFTTQNPPTDDGVSTPKPRQMEGLNPVTHDAPTLKRTLSKESAAPMIEKEDNPKQPPATGGWSWGANGRAVIKMDGEQWQAWLAHNKVNDPNRHRLMIHAYNISRHREWEEAQPWPPATVTDISTKQAVSR
jgi:hypothetical protein